MTPPARRQEEIDGFQKHGGIFLAQQTAAGIGITLTRAHEIVLVEPSWSPSDNDQAIKRIHRIGQDKPCRARIFLVPDSLDEAVMGTLLRKQKMLTEVGL
jgi:SNF2 family DNA or RNA helicase